MLVNRNHIGELRDERVRKYGKSREKGAEGCVSRGGGLQSPADAGCSFSLLVSTAKCTVAIGLRRGQNSID